MKLEVFQVVLYIVTVDLNIAMDASSDGDQRDGGREREKDESGTTARKCDSCSLN